MKLDAASNLALRVVGALEPFCEKIEVAGSIRRQCAQVNDIDLVLVPRDREAVLERVKRHCFLKVCGPMNVIAIFKSGFQLDIFMAHAGVRDLICPMPSNWGSLMLCRTGPKEHNVALAALAKGRKMHWDPYRGICDGDGNCILASETEEEIYRALGLQWIEPRERHRALFAPGAA